jgi:hypothetical protein
MAHVPVFEGASAVARLLVTRIRLPKIPFCLRARLQPCRKCSVCSGALAPEVRFLGNRQLFKKLLEERKHPIFEVTRQRIEEHGDFDVFYRSVLERYKSPELSLAHELPVGQDPEATDSITVVFPLNYFLRFRPRNRMSSPKTI